MDLNLWGSLWGYLWGCLHFGRKPAETKRVSTDLRPNGYDYGNV